MDKVIDVVVQSLSPEVVKTSVEAIGVANGGRVEIIRNGLTGKPTLIRITLPENRAAAAKEQIIVVPGVSRTITKSIPFSGKACTAMSCTIDHAATELVVTLRDKDSNAIAQNYLGTFQQLLSFAEATPLIVSIAKIVGIEDVIKTGDKITCTIDGQQQVFNFTSNFPNYANSERLFWLGKDGKIYFDADLTLKA